MFSNWFGSGNERKKEKPRQITTEEILDNPDEYLKDDSVVEPLASHISREQGEKLLAIDDDPQTFYLEAGVPEGYLGKAGLVYAGSLMGGWLFGLLKGVQKSSFEPNIRKRLNHSLNAAEAMSRNAHFLAPYLAFFCATRWIASFWRDDLATTWFATCVPILLFYRPAQGRLYKIPVMLAACYGMTGYAVHNGEHFNKIDFQYLKNVLLREKPQSIAKCDDDEENSDVWDNYYYDLHRKLIEQHNQETQ